MNSQVYGTETPHRNSKGSESEAQSSNAQPHSQSVARSCMCNATASDSSTPDASTTQRSRTPESTFYVCEDFEDVVTTWGRYNTDELVKTSPYYTKIEIGVDPHAKMEFPEMSNVTERTVHAVHPIPRSDLENLGPICMHDLAEQLDQERWDVERDHAMNARIQETLARIDDILEFAFHLYFPGTRMFSGRQPTWL